jgi:ribonuclease R
MPLPDKETLMAWLRDNPGQGAKREIARAFGLKGADRIELKRMLKEMSGDGLIARERRAFRAPDQLPPVSVLRVLAADTQGDQWAAPAEWDGPMAPPRIAFIPRKGDRAMGEGTRFLGRLTPTGDGYEARLIRVIEKTSITLLGIFRPTAEGGRIQPIDKGQDKEWRVPAGLTAGARDGELVEAELAGPRRMGLPSARVTARLGDPGAPRAISLIAIHQHGIPDHFPDTVLAEAAAAPEATAAGRTDLRDLPLLTIDPVDARDRDDAVAAMPDDDPANPGGHILWVAIADVAHYVRPGSALDREARKRGNSTYFPDRVVPMLPDRLSGDLCSLHEGVDRACLALRMVIDAQGHKRSHRFHRGLMRSRASLSYEAAQGAIAGEETAATPHLAALRPLWAAYAALKLARAARAPLELDLPERRIVLDDAGHVTSVAFKERFDAHRLIEEFMVLANVAAAEELIARRTPQLFRVHEEPEPLKLDALREVVESVGLRLPKGQVLTTRALNGLLAASAGTDQAEMIHIQTLRSMPQAFYDPQNLGHFGLALRAYAHFTSPIRRYADLIVHRALIAAHGFGDDGLSPRDIENLAETGKLISDAERRSMMAERDTADRYLAAFLSDRIGATFTGRVSGVQKFGLFVKLDETGADGLIPMRAIGAEFFHYDDRTQTIMGADTGLTIGVGQRVTVRLVEAAPVTGGLLLALEGIKGATLPPGRPARRSHGRPGKPAKPARKVTRRRRD